MKIIYSVTKHLLPVAICRIWQRNSRALLLVMEIFIYLNCGDNYSCTVFAKYHHTEHFNTYKLFLSISLNLRKVALDWTISYSCPVICYVYNYVSLSVFIYYFTIMSFTLNSLVFVKIKFENQNYISKKDYNVCF